MRQHAKRIVHSCFSCKFSVDKSCRSCLAVRWNFHFSAVTCPPPRLPRSRALCTGIFIFESILCGLLLSQQILKLHDSSFLCIAAWFNSSPCDGPRRRVSMCYSRKRAEAEGRKGSFPCSKAMSSHHPTDPVELRRINFQTPGKPGKRSRTHTGTESTCSYMCVLQSTVFLFFCFFCLFF